VKPEEKATDSKDIILFTILYEDGNMLRELIRLWSVEDSATLVKKNLAVGY